MHFVLQEESQCQTSFLSFLSEEKKQLKAEIDGVPVAVIFDGTLRLGEALAVILRFVDRSTLKSHQRLVHMQLLAKSLTGEEVA